jgi:hypothetical protein
VNKVGQDELLHTAAGWLYSIDSERPGRRAAAGTVAAGGSPKQTFLAWICSLLSLGEEDLAEDFSVKTFKGDKQNNMMKRTR